MKTPFFGTGYVSRSPNFADDRLINLYSEINEDKNGKNVGAFYLAPGLSAALATCGSGPIWGFGQLGNGLLYVVSGNAVYTVSSSYAVTLIGSFTQNPPNAGPVSIIANTVANGAQLGIFTTQAGYIVPGGYPLTGGSISATGSQYAVGDTVVLNQAGGTQSATPSITISSVNGSGGVTGFTIVTSGAFQTLPTSFTQATTTGSGAGLQITSPTFGANVPVYTISLPFTVPAGNTQLITASQQDGFALINQPGSYVMWQSNELDFSIWDPLNFASASGDPDNIVAIHQIHITQFIIKQQDTEVWFNAGVAGFTFQRYQTVFLEVGCLAAATVRRCGESLIWLAQNPQGQAIVVEIDGYSPKKISTHALDYAIQQYSTVSDAIAYSYQMAGHTFYVITFPTGNQTWVYDKTSSELVNMPMWYMIGAFSMGVFNRHWGQAFSFFNGVPIVGDYLTGNLYAYQFSALTDNGTQRKWLRTWRALQQPTNQPTRFSELQIDMQTGIGVPSNTNPKCMLRWSDDGGHTWSNEIIDEVGPIGATAQRVMFRRMGSTRRNSGLDRIFELSSTDQFPAALIGAELR